MDLMFHTSAVADTQEEPCFWFRVVHCELDNSHDFEKPSSTFKCRPKNIVLNCGF